MWNFAQNPAPPGDRTTQSANSPHSPGDNDDPDCTSCTSSFLTTSARYPSAEISLIHINTGKYTSRSNAADTSRRSITFHHAKHFTINIDGDLIINGIASGSSSADAFTLNYQSAASSGCENIPLFYFLLLTPIIAVCNSMQSPPPSAFVAPDPKPKIVIPSEV